MILKNKLTQKVCQIDFEKKFDTKIAEDENTMGIEISKVFDRFNIYLEGHPFKNPL